MPSIHRTPAPKVTDTFTCLPAQTNLGAHS